MGMGPMVIFALVMAFVCVVALIAHDVGRRRGHADCAQDVLRSDRYSIAVDDLDKWCGHESPQARLIAQHLRAEGEGMPMNAGTPFGNEPCVVSGLREQLRRLEK